ncbi:MAG: DUF481 domain-containing protein [Planctomycetota bacterium]
MPNELVCVYGRSLTGIVCLCLIILVLNLGLPSATFGQLDLALTPGEIVEEVAPVPAWKGNFSAGLNGKSGNSEDLDFNLALDLTRETDFATTNFLANYFYSSNQIATTTDRWFSQFRQERKFEDPRWSWFYQSGLEVDRFKDFDYRIALHSGLAYKLIDEEIRKLKLRLGAGASREVGSVNDDWSPELQFGADWERKLSETTRIYATVDFFPNVSDFADYRLNTNTGLEFLLDAERDINFKIFALNRYDSTPPPGNQENDLDYGMSVGIGF